MHVFEQSGGRSNPFDLAVSIDFYCAVLILQLLAASRSATKF